MKLIPLTQGKFAQVDDDDFDFLNQWKWHCRRSPHTCYAITVFYPSNSRKTIQVRMHWLVIPTSDNTKIVDHINHQGLDNQKKNLRLCSHIENSKNKNPSKGSSSKYLGVSWRKSRNCWVSQIQLGGKNKHIGCYNNEVEAALAYNKKAKKLFGDFANLNKLKNETDHTKTDTA